MVAGASNRLVSVPVNDSAASLSLVESARKARHDELDRALEQQRKIVEEKKQIRQALEEKLLATRAASAPTEQNDNGATQRFV